MSDQPPAMREKFRVLADERLRIKYNEDGKWRIEIELANKATISVNNKMDGELARAQIRGIFAELAEQAAQLSEAEIQALAIKLTEGYPAGELACSEEEYEQIMKRQAEDAAALLREALGGKK
jgi:hypothetical protein